MRSNHQHQPTHEEIAQHAFQLWTQAGHPEGCDQQHWLQAEAELRSRIGTHTHIPRQSSHESNVQSVEHRS